MKLLNQFLGIFLKNLFLLKTEYKFYVLTLLIPIIIVLIFRYVLEILSGYVMYLLLFSCLIQILELQRGLLVHLVNEKFIGFKTYFKVNGIKEFPYIVSEILFYYLKGFIVIYICKSFLKLYPDFFDMEYLFDFMYIMCSLSINMILIISVFIQNPIVAADLSTYMFFGLNIFSFVYCINNVEISLWMCFIPQLPMAVLLRNYIVDLIFNNDIQFNDETYEFYYYSICYCLLTFILYFLLDYVFPYLQNYKYLKKVITYKQDNDINNTGLTIKNVSKYYGSFKAIDNISINLEKSKISCLLGHNGAGKSTLINLISGILSAEEGNIYYDGKLIDNLRNNNNFSIGYCPPNDILYNDLTVYNHFIIMKFIKSEKITEKSINTILENFNLLQYKYYKIKELSEGNKRKLSIALSTIGNIKILFLDEPTSNVDPNSRRKIWKIIKNIKKTDTIIILASHSMDEVEELSDNIFLMLKGKIIKEGNISQLKYNYGEGYNFKIKINNKEKINNLLYSFKNIIGAQSFKDSIITNINNDIIDIKINNNLIEKANIYKIIKDLFSEYPIKMYVSKFEDVYLKINYVNGYEDKYFTNENELLTTINSLNLNNESKFIVKLWYLVYRRVLFFVKNINQIIIYLLNNSLLYVILIFIFSLDLRDEISNNIFNFPYRNIVIILFCDLISSSTNSVLGYFITYEKNMKIKNYLYLNKVSMLEYYLSTYLADILLQIIPILALFPILTKILSNNLFMLGYFKYSDIHFILKMIILSKINFITYSYFICLVIFSDYKKVLKYFLIIWFLSLFPAFIIYRIFKDYECFVLIISNLINPYTYLIIMFNKIENYTDEDIIINGQMNNNTLLINYLLFTIIFNLIYLFVIIIFDYYVYFKRSPGIFEIKPIKNKHIVSEYKDKNSLNDEINNIKNKSDYNLVLDSVSKTYIKDKEPAIYDINFGIKSAETFALLGQNGAGKSTIINTICGLIKRGSGKIDILSKNIDNYTPFDKERIGVCIQNNCLWDNLTVAQHFQIYGNILKCDIRLINAIIDLLELKEHIHKSITMLSSGNKRKTIIGLSFLGNPKLLLLDEATCGVDIRMRINIRNYLNFIKKNNKTSILLTTHMMEEAEFLSDRLTFIKDGELLFINTIDELKNKENGYKLQLSLYNNNDIGDIKVLFENMNIIIQKYLNLDDNHIFFLKNITKILELLLKLEKHIEDKKIIKFDIKNISLDDIFILYNN